MLNQLPFHLADLNQTASYFGDFVLSWRQIYKVVDNVFGTMSIVSQEGPTMTHEQCIKAVAKDTLLKQFLSKDSRSIPRVTFSPIHRIRREDGSEFSADTVSIPLTPIAAVQVRTSSLESVASSSKPVTVRKSALKKPSRIDTKLHVDVTNHYPQKNRPSWMSRRRQ